MASSDIPIGCFTPGYFFDEQTCCYPNNQTQSDCTPFIGPNASDILLATVCPSGNCLKDCQDPKMLYGGVADADGIHNEGTIRMYMACAAVPAIASYDANGVLLPDQSALVRNFIPPGDTTEENLRGVTATVTECLTQTCLGARNGSLYYDQYCAPTRLLINGTLPNQTAINQCLNTLCNNPAEVIPFANSDIIGIGIFSSYVLQLLLVTFMWFGLVVKGLIRWRRFGWKNATEQETEGPPESLPRESWLRFLLEFHKAQCYFSGTLMIAIFVSGIVKINVAMIFLLLPLTMNGIVPVVFAYLMLTYHGVSSSAITLLTITVYTISTVAFWILYASLRSLITPSTLSYDVWTKYVYGLSEIDACGGFSALTACPDNLDILGGKDKARAASELLWFIPPLVWSISTAVLLGIVTAEGWERIRGLRYQAVPLPEQQHESTSKETDATSKRIPTLMSNKTISTFMSNKTSRRINVPLVIVVAFWLTTFVLLGCALLQMYLLSINLSLDMFNARDWSFGQVVAITIWAQPVFDYSYSLLRKRVMDMRR